MIQRIQSIFLFLAAAFFGATFYFPFASSDEAIPGILADRLFNIFDSPFLLILVGLGIALSIINLFTFKNRTLQARLGYLGIIISIFVGLVGVLLFMQSAPTIADSIELSEELGIYLPLGSLICTGLAIHFINKDEKLVKSMDRLR